MLRQVAVASPTIRPPLTPTPFTLLLVAATDAELSPLRRRLDDEAAAHGHAPGVAFRYLVTGVGPVATAAALTEELVRHPADLVLNLGLAGALDRGLPLRHVAVVASEQFGDLGAEDRDGSYLDLFALGLADRDAEPFTDGLLRSFPDAPAPAGHRYAARLSSLAEAVHRAFPKPEQRVAGTTVSRTHGSARSIEAFRTQTSAVLESMEGAAVFYCALRQNTPCLQLRAVSNYVEPRDRDAWDVSGALAALTDRAYGLLSDFRQGVRDAPYAPPPRSR